MSEHFLFDAHLDLALNAMEWNRDLTRPIAEIRAAEAGRQDKPGRGGGTVCLPELRCGRIGLVVTTQMARVKHDDGRGVIASWHSASQAWAMTQAQLAWYHAMQEAGEMAAIRSREDLDRHVALWQNAEKDALQRLPIGYLLSLEGADSLVTLAHLERAYAQGLRAVGPAHFGAGTYAQGTGTTGGFPPRGRELLAEMGRLGLILDITHLSDECFWEAMDSYTGPIWASHHNCHALVPNQRQLDDEQIRALVARDAVIGVALDALMLVPGWVRGQTTPESAGLRLEAVVNHIDHICQIAGNAKHVGLGSDLDGAFGREQTAVDLDTIADLKRLPEMLPARGYSAGDAQNFAHGNFLRFLRRALRP
jgi:membrane dipeptidase